MKILLNTLYINQKDVTIGKNGENIVIYQNDDEIARFPIHLFESIVCSNYTGISPAALELCNKAGVCVSFVNEYGFIAKIQPKDTGNVILRLQQYKKSFDQNFCLETSKNIIIAKLINSSRVLKAFANNRQGQEREKILSASIELKDSVKKIDDAADIEHLRGVEGDMARLYFSVFDNLILHKYDGAFSFDGRIKHPPVGCINVLLSYCYTLLTSDISAACQAVGLDKQVGFMHSIRVGRDSLSCDIIEELRSCICDRFVLKVINLKQITDKDFILNADGLWYLTDDSRKKFLKLWQEYKKEKIYHPFLDKNIEIGLLAYIQATLMARYIREDLDYYPPFFI